MTPRHNWSVNDDVVSFYLSKFKGEEDLPYSLEEIANLISNKCDSFVGSLKMRISNFKSLAGGRGLRNTSSQQRKIYNEFKDTPKEELRAVVLEILAEKIRSLKPQ